MIRSSSSSVFFSVSSVDVAPPLDANSSKVSAPPSLPVRPSPGLGHRGLGLDGFEHVERIRVSRHGRRRVGRCRLLDTPTAAARWLPRVSECQLHLGRPRRIGFCAIEFLTKNGQFYGRCDSRKRVCFVLFFVSREFAVFVWRRGKKAFTASKVIPASASTPRTLSSDTAHSRCKRGTGARRVHPRLVASRIQSHQCRAHEIPPFP